MGKKLKFEKSHKKEKWRIFSTAPTAAERVLLKGPRIELFFNKQMVIEGCRGIFEYGEDYIKLKISEGVLLIYGKGFDILSFQDETMILRGEIMSLEYGV